MSEELKTIRLSHEQAAKLKWGVAVKGQVIIACVSRQRAAHLVELGKYATPGGGVELVQLAFPAPEVETAAVDLSRLLDAPKTYTVGHDGRSTIYVYQHKRTYKSEVPSSHNGFKVVLEFVGKIRPATPSPKDATP